MKKFVLSVVIAFAFATPSLAQSYSAGYGSGNLIATPLLEKTNGANGYFGTVQSPTARTAKTSRAASGTSAYAYSPPTSHRHKTHSKSRDRWWSGAGLWARTRQAP